MLPLKQQNYSPSLEAEDTLQYFGKTSSAWDAMYKDCEAAQHSIDFEQYILLDDQAGNRFLKLFADKAEQGVKIRLLIDNIGSLGLSLSPEIKRLIKSGGEFRYYNPLGFSTIFMLSSWCPRNHTKTLIIDDKVGYIGSACVSEVMSDWRDLHVRFTGRLVRDVRDAFDLSAKKHDLPPPSELLDRKLRYVASFPHLGRNPFYQELVDAIRNSKSSVSLVTPYFIPPWRLRRALYQAVRRGVRVRVMISEHSDVPIADYVSRSYFKRFLRHRIELLLYRPAMLHAKYVIVDDTWATVGSSNMDYLSLLRNREANIVFRNRNDIKNIQAEFDRDLQDCFKVDWAYCRAIPLYQRALGWLARSMKRIL